MIIKEQALKIVSDLINDHKINGKDAVVLIQAILKESNPGCGISNPPYQGTITTTVTGNVTDNIDAVRPKGMEVIYG